MQDHLSKTIFESNLSDEIAADFYMPKPKADTLFNFFKTHPLFLWHDIHNCEDRAEAISILLSHWGIPHYKAWVFNAYFLKKESGNLHNDWNYHVSVALPVMENNFLNFYVIDPAHSSKIECFQRFGIARSY